MAKPLNARLPGQLALALLCLLTSLGGCAQDYSLAPSANGEQVTVRVKVPNDLKARTMQVMYRSSSCQRTRYDAYGKPYKVDGFHGVDVQPQREGQSDIYEAKLAKDGGGACRWHLANVIFGVEYRNPEQFGAGVTFAAGGGVVVIFDNNDSPMGGADKKVDGDLIISQGYYPWIDEEFLGGYRKTVRLAGRGIGFIKYKAPNAREVFFKPTLFPKYLVASAGPRVKLDNSYTRFEYPDGSILENRDIEPRFDKLESIRLAAENKK
ncbi:hypothetical protein ACQCLI_13760 [Pseudomonas nitroreducens]|uniref:hypothetical protein n=1 Tax=Pseudomonas nitroreducens TaxID=46680 RepID=UPI0003765524|nr:hypothetical protein [Pseudomonas nitroreducens]